MKLIGTSSAQHDALKCDEIMPVVPSWQHLVAGTVILFAKHPCNCHEVWKLPKEELE
jgi:hypothetical protein